MTPLIGRALQIAGMIVLPIGLCVGMLGGDVRTEVKLLAIGAFMFLLGWILAKKN
jgi:hypothetical protein